MKKNSGISVISLVVTIIVLVIITSVTTYVGSKTFDQSRKTQASSRLEAVATAILAYEQELGYATTITDEFTQIKAEDYYTMRLQDFANTEKFPPILINKTIDETDPYKKIYTLKTPKYVKTNGVYQEDEYVVFEKAFYEEKTTQHFKVEFDSIRGVNRPLLTSQMIPIKLSFAGTDDPLPQLVKDIYTDEWYNYSTEAPMWANVMVDGSNTMYVWIPRFAYSIQSFYIGKDFGDIPASAIKIIFCKGTSDLMPNDEVLPTGFQVHPAFQYKDEYGNTINLAGFWVAKRNIDFADSISSGSGVVATQSVLLENLHPEMNSSEVESHLIKNSEWAAIAYLSHATVGKMAFGNSLKNSASGVLELNDTCFVAGGLKSVVYGSAGEGTIPYADRYVYVSDDLSYESFEGYSGDNYGSNLSRKFGDGIVATSSGLGDHSAWFGGRSDKPTLEKPYILRGLESNLFSYSCSENHPTVGAMFRNVLIVNPK